MIPGETGAQTASALPTKQRSRKRTTHIIRPNARGSTPTVRVYVDTEAWIDVQPNGNQRQTLWFGHAVCEYHDKRRADGIPAEEWLRFTTPEAFFTWLDIRTREKSTTYVYAHNWQYDAAMLSLASMAQQYEWTITQYVPAAHLLWLTMRKDGRTLCFVDTLNYFAMSLKTLGKNIGEHKQESDSHPQDVAWWDHYCKQDVKVIQTAMHYYFDFISTNDLGMYRKTLASQAYGAWRHRFMHVPVMILADERVEALERSAYHGGRSEVYYDKRLTGPLYQLDINSMYPSVMQSERYPYQKVAKGKRSTPETLASWLTDYSVVARVLITTDQPVYPYVTKDRVIYPVGTFETSLSTGELRYALAHDHIREVYEWVTYDHAPLFADYMTELYSYRLDYAAKGNEAFKFMCKIMMNSLYGKFGQRGFVWNECPHLPPDFSGDVYGNCEADGPILTHRVRFGLTWHRERDTEAFESFPAIAAHVTSYARMLLWQLRTTAGLENVYYCDTDSLYVNETGYQRLLPHIDATKLGMLKVEAVHAWAHFHAPKDYALPEYSKIKGIRANAWKLSDTEYEQIQFESYDRVIERGEDGVIIVKPLVKHLTRENRQSKPVGDGWRTPYVLNAATSAELRPAWTFPAVPSAYDRSDPSDPE